MFLADSEMPRRWYNIQADMPNPLQPPLHPATGEPVKPEDLAAIFPMSLIEQEMSQERFIEIPEAVLEKLLLYRPTPLQRAYNLEKYLDTPAKIFYKNESVSPAGSHKPNIAIAQAYYNKREGVKRLTTETGAGQWGSALSLGCAMFGLECKVYMVKVSYEQKPYRRLMMKTWGGTCVASPSMDTNFGRKILAENPDTPGSLGIAISEAIEDAVTSENTKYSLGSVLNHVMLHQTVIGLEAQRQMEKAGVYPDVVIGCAGGGSNFAGLSFPFVRDKIYGRDVRIVAVEPAACPSMTKGPFAYDFGDTAATTPLLPMFTLGHNFVPKPIHAGGLRYHGMAPLVSQLVLDKLVEPRAIDQIKTYEAGVLFARTEGIIPAPETNHAIAAVVEEALKAREEGRPKVILFCFSGHGILDLAAYDKFLNGELVEYHLSDEEIKENLKVLQDYPKPRINRQEK
ncbi:TrpB-like pyridoxal phosphate-dependent enzyme [Moorella sulfitireducens (nom. illeg.)]|uniref:TrpB-like pyridoxal phosphate-dependent enzyme n=1 Tax=Neomoorella sulfitireducens TaxID=2972948 RepID=UPI0021AD3DCA